MTTTNELPTVDWASLQQRSLLSGGFGADRIHLWPRLLHALPELEERTLQTEPHPDERQIALDTNRSFVLYGSGTAVNDEEQKLALQNELHDLLVRIFRSHPKLSYFQGYHDILSVLLLTLPASFVYPSAVSLSLHRTRDSMGKGLEPVLGLLRLLKNLLQLADPAYASLLSGISPLPYYALSNLLTLFAHDMPTLPLIQHVFDWLLCREPGRVVWLAAAIILSRKSEVQKLIEEDEDGMVHSLLSGLPDITDGLPPSHAAAMEEKVHVSQEQRETVDVEGEDPETSAEEKVEEERGPIDEEELTLLSDETSTLLEHDDELTLLEIPSPETKKEAIELSTLLTYADTLYTLYPPSHPLLSLSSIMGPNSVLFTWSEDPPDPTVEVDDLVEDVALVVLPYQDEIESEKEERRKEITKRERAKWIRVNPETLVFVLVLGVSVALAVYNGNGNLSTSGY